MEQRYNYLRPISFNMFLAVSCLVLVLRVANQNSVTWISFIIAILWGGVACGIGNLSFIMLDLFTGEIEPEQQIDNKSDEDNEDEREKEFQQVLRKRLDDKKFYYGKGMITLSENEGKELEKYYRDRWFGDTPRIVIPSYVSGSLLNLLSSKGLVEDNRLTSVGEKIIPTRQA